ncbi:hypothetical protein F6455_15620 [Proteobacteria bacterium 005FR1]|nr:hypothetical protein [Proteobacteria bacterium 005FR1]
MTAVKGSKPTRLMVVPYRPYARLLTWAGFALAVVLMAAASYFLGNHHGIGLQKAAIAERDQLRLDLQRRNAELESLSQEVANLKLASEVDKASSEGVRSEVITLKSQIAALEEDITFYRGLMAPTDNRRGLTIGSLDVIASGAPRRYDFKIVVQQLATNHQVLNGLLQVNVIGHEGGLTRSIPLKDLSPQIEDESIKLRFKYFQNIVGQIELPEGFEPERIELTASSSGRDGVSVEKKFGWLVHES